MIAAGQIRLGDYVRLDGGQDGYITDIGWRSTTIRMLANNLVLVPNAKLAQAVITNYDLPEPELAVLVDVGVDYASDLGHVERVTIEVARDVLRTTEGAVADFEPFIRYHTFGDSSVKFTVILRGTRFVSQYAIKHEFIKRLHQRYAAEGIIIPFPMRTLIVRHEESSAGRVQGGVPVS
jgi:small-conductance mechanosensitive channel